MQSDISRSEFEAQLREALVIPDEHVRNAALSRISMDISGYSVMYGESDLIDRALVVARSITDVDLRNRTLSDISLALMEVGSFDGENGAFAFARLITDDHVRGEVISRIDRVRGEVISGSPAWKRRRISNI